MLIRRSRSAFRDVGRGGGDAFPKVPLLGLIRARTIRFAGARQFEEERTMKAIIYESYGPPESSS